MGLRYSNREARKEEFDREAKEFFTKNGHVVILERTLKGRRRPDLIAIKDGELLMVETKSPKEAKSHSCLYTYKGDYLEECQKQARTTIKDRDVAKWFVHIGGQLMHYATNLGKEWNVPNEDVSKFKVMPAIIFPADEMSNVKSALKKMRIPAQIFLALSEKQTMLKFKEVI